MRGLTILARFRCEADWEDPAWLEAFRTASRATPPQHMDAMLRVGDAVVHMTQEAYRQWRAAGEPNV